MSRARELLTIITPSHSVHYEYEYEYELIPELICVVIKG